MDRNRFERLVKKTINDLPLEFFNGLQNIDVVVEDYPTPRQVHNVGLKDGHDLLGLYEGVPQTKRGIHYGLVPPDKITIFQRSIEAVHKNDRDITREIQKVVRHEIAHHFGISDARLRQIKRDKKTMD
ncbi:metallopeptidase family protein [Chloroflexota bacterium]